ncbi:MAG: CapA family protein [Candidatus Promineifilaceae bacterium]
MSEASAEVASELSATATASPTLTQIPPSPTPTTTPTQTPTPTLTPSPTATPSPSPTPTVTPTPAPAVLAFVGDVMLGRSLGQYINWGQSDYPFRHVRESLASADFTIANLESALGDVGKRAPKGYTFQAPPAAADVLADAGIDLVSLANNHALDFGVESLVQGMALLDKAAVASVGAGLDETEARAPHLVTINGTTFGFLNYVHVPVEWRGFDTQNWQAIGDEAGMAWGDPLLISADVTALRPKVDHLIVLIHSGFEGETTPSPPQIAASHAAIDAGADVVIGHHAHILQGVEQRGDGVIFYGLGNFAFDFDEEQLTRSVILNLHVTHDGLLTWEFVPVMVAINGQPRLALPDEASIIHDLIEQASLRLDSAE